MALNPTTGIDYDVDRFAIRLVSTGDLINLNALWPRVDGAAVSGANSDRAYYKRVSAEKPDADHRFYISSTWTVEDFSPALDPVDGLPVGEFKQSHVLTKLPVDELKAQVETAFQAELMKRFPDTADPSVLIAAGGALARKSDGAQLTAEQTAAVEAIKGVEDAVTQLRARQAEMDAAIDADEDFDITDWSISE